MTTRDALVTLADGSTRTVPQIVIRQVNIGGHVLAEIKRWRSSLS